MEGGSGSRTMRSQVCPEWTAKEALILVNEIAAVEADCLNALSSFQKWKIISQNCNALDVPRNFNQCRRKWDSLLAQYTDIIRLRSETETLPPNFDHELFQAIDNLVRSKQNQSDTDSDTDPEAEPDLSQVIAVLGTKKRKLPMEDSAEDEFQKSQTQEKSCSEEKPCKSNVEENQERDKKSKKSQAEEKCYMEGKNTGSREEKKEMMVGKLYENAELIHAIVNETSDYDAAADFNNVHVQRFQSDFVRLQGDKLIACLGEIVNTLNQFSDHVQECE